jgi:hypothetical protein
MPTIPGPVDDAGNITVPAEGGATIPIKEMSTDEPSEQIDISSLPLNFYVAGRFEIVPGPNPNDVFGRLLVITEANADILSTKGHPFQLLDLTDPDVPIPLWSGTIRRGE